MGVYFDQQRQQWRVEIRMTVNGVRVKRKKRLPKLTTQKEAEAINAQMEADAILEASGVMNENTWLSKVNRALGTKDSWLHNMLKGARGRARSKGREMTLTADELADLLRESEGRCSVSGMTFNEQKMSGSKMRPFSPSLDRRDGTKGYTKDNCRIVCSAVNMAMYNWGEDIYRAFAIGTVMHSMLLPEAQKVLGIRNISVLEQENDFADATLSD